MANDLVNRINEIEKVVGLIELDKIGVSPHYLAKLNAEYELTNNDLRTIAAVASKYNTNISTISGLLSEGFDPDEINGIYNIRDSLQATCKELYGTKQSISISSIKDFYNYLRTNEFNEDEILGAMTEVILSSTSRFGNTALKRHMLEERLLGGRIINDVLVEEETNPWKIDDNDYCYNQDFDSKNMYYSHRGGDY